MRRKKTFVETRPLPSARRKCSGRVSVQRDPAGLTPLLETRVIEATELTMQHKASEPTLATQASLLELNQLRGVAPEAHLSIRSTQGQSRRSKPLARKSAGPSRGN